MTMTIPGEGSERRQAAGHVPGDAQQRHAAPSPSAGQRCSARRLRGPPAAGKRREVSCRHWPLHSPLICTCSHPSPTCVKGALTLVYYCKLLQFLCLQDLGLVCCRNVNELGVKLQLLSWLSWVWEWQGFAEFLVLGGHW